MRQLRIGKIVTKSYFSVFRHSLDFLRISWIWLLVAAFLLWLLLYGHLAEVAFQFGEWGLIALLLLPYAVVFLAMASIASAWHRIVLNDNPPKRLFYWNIGLQVWRYFGATFVFTLMGNIFIGLPMMALGTGEGAFNDSVQIILTLVFVVGWLLSGFALILPATALGHNKVGFGRLFQLGSGNRIKLMIIQVLTVLPFFGVLLLFKTLYISSFSFWGVLLYLIPCWLIFLSGLSFSYKALNPDMFQEGG